MRTSGVSMALVLLVAARSLSGAPDVVTLIPPLPPAVGSFGLAVSGAGDVNGDGIADVIVGAENMHHGGAYVFSGRNAQVLLELSSPHDQFDDRFGQSVSGAGDVNRDGFSDLLVGAHAERPAESRLQAGRAYLFSGKDGSLLFELASPHKGEAGNLGRTLSSAGDVNQDGFPDVIAGALLESPGDSPNEAGRAYVFSGRNGQALLELVSPHETGGGHFGWSVSGAGDVNRDGSTDLVVGAIDEGPSPERPGRAYVFSGRDGVRLLELNTPHPERMGGFGNAVAGVGDLNQDGYADVIVGTREGPQGSPRQAGRAYVFSGHDGQLLFELKSPHEELGGHFGLAVAGAGDVNQDGFGDVIVGAQREASFSGRAYVFSGRDGELLHELKSPNVDEHNGSFGISIAAAGDVDQDGSADVVVGADHEDSVAGHLDTGRAYIFLSRDSATRNGIRRSPE